MFRSLPRRIVLLTLSITLACLSQAKAQNVGRLPAPTVTAASYTSGSSLAAYPTGSPGSQVSVVPGLNDDGTPCNCRTGAGGYPCKGPCQKCIMGVDCQGNCGAEARWRDMRPIPFDQYGPGGYAGPSRYAHLGVYRLRPNDQLQIIYLITRRQDSGEYRLAPGDELLIESMADPDLLRGTLERGLVIQPDGTITVRLIGQIHAAGLTVAQLRKVLEQKYLKLYDEPSIDVTPVKVNTLAEDIRNAVGGAGGLNQQALDVTVQPDGKIRLPGIGGVCVQGLSLARSEKGNQPALQRSGGWARGRAHPDSAGRPFRVRSWSSRPTKPYPASGADHRAGRHFGCGRASRGSQHAASGDFQAGRGLAFDLNHA